MSKNKVRHNTILHLLIKLGFIAILAGFLMLIYSEGNVRDVDLKEVQKTLVKEYDLGKEMKHGSQRDVMEFFGLDANNFEQTIYYRNTTELAVEELLIIKTASKDEAIQAAEAVNKRIAGQIKAYQSYGPSQVKQLKNARVEQIGNYLFYCTSDNAKKYEGVLKNAIQ